MSHKIVLLSLVFTLFFACDSSDQIAPKNSDNFDRGVMLTNLADNIIIPAYQDLDAQLTLLKTAKDNFTTSPTAENFTLVRDAWVTSYKTWQHLEMFNIGLAEKIYYSGQMNVYPTNVTDIESNINSGNADLGNASNHDAVGFPALDYMLYGLATDDAAILSKYTTDVDANKRKKHLSDLVDRMHTLTQTVLTDWTTSYRNEFVSNTANNASGSVNKFVNDYIFYFEKEFRSYKFGVPSGSSTAIPLPDRVEGFYCKTISKQLALESLQCVTAVYNGRHYNQSTIGVGLKGYLDFLNRSDLSKLINTQLDAIKVKVESLNADFQAQIAIDNTQMTQTVDIIQLALLSIKVDLLQAFNINIDYTDNDGD